MLGENEGEEEGAWALVRTERGFRTSKRRICVRAPPHEDGMVHSGVSTSLRIRPGTERGNGVVAHEETQPDPPCGNSS